MSRVPVDSLSPAVKEDLIVNLQERVFLLSQEPYQTIRGNLFGLVDPPMVVLKELPVAELINQVHSRQYAPSVVDRYTLLVMAGVEFDPIIVSGTKFIDGIHRLRAYDKAKKELIPVVDISELLEMDWQKWLAGNPADECR